MSKSALGLRHTEKRKKAISGKNPYPHPVAWKGFIDRMIYVVGVSGPIMTIPQAVKIWGDKSAIDVSAISWSFYLFVSLFWITYGIAHQTKPIIITYSAWFAIELTIVIGIFLYK